MKFLLLTRANDIAANLRRKRNEHPELTPGEQAIGLAMMEKFQRLEARVTHLEHGGQMDE